MEQTESLEHHCAQLERELAAARARIAELERQDDHRRHSLGSLWRLAELSMFPVVLTSLENGSVLIANRAAQTLFGGREAIIVHLRTMDFWVSSEVRAVFLRTLAEHGEVIEFEAQLRTLDGEIRDVLISSRRIFLDTQACCFSIFSDMTAQKQIARALAKSRAVYRTIVESLPDGMILLFDPGLRFVRIGGEGLEQLGLHRADVEGRTLHEVFPDEFSSQVTEVVQGLFEGRKFEKEILYAGRYFNIHGTPIRDDKGTIIRGLAFAMDITERKQAEARIRDSAYRYGLLASNVRDVIWAMDAQYRMTFISPSVTRLLGYSVEEVEGKTPDQWMAPATLQLFFAARSQRQDEERDGHSDNATREWRFEFVRKDGSSVWTESLVTPHRGPDGAFLGLVGVTRDITERMRIQVELEAAKEAALAASRVKSEFLANMSHEIRTPLNGIMGMLQIMQSTPLDEEQRDFVDTALVSGRSLLGVINDILDFSKIEAGKVRLSADWIELAGMLMSQVKSFQSLVRHKDVVLSYAMGPDVPTMIMTDDVRLRQILFNLLGNAAKFTAKGEIRIAVDLLRVVAPDRVFLQFEVTDTGIGIAKDQIDRLFEPFTQADGSYTRQYQGTGLGLSIVRRLVALMGGEVDLQSTEGVGTSVRFTLPVGIDAERRIASSEAGTSRATRSDGSGRSILLVDDDRFNEKVVSAMLRRHGFTVTGMSNGRMALDELRHSWFDMILLDIQMPEMDGLETTRRIRTDPAFAHVAGIPIIALTAHALAGDRARCLAAGMDAYISKPVDMHELLATIARMLRPTSP